MQLTKFDWPAEGALTTDEINMLLGRGAARVVVERDPSAGGGITAIGIEMRRGEPPINLLLFRIARPGMKRTDGDGRSISVISTLEQASPTNRDRIMARIAKRVSEVHDGLPPEDHEAEEGKRS